MTNGPFLPLLRSDPSFLFLFCVRQVRAVGDRLGAHNIQGRGRAGYLFYSLGRDLIMALKQAASKMKVNLAPLLKQAYVMDAPFSLGSKLVGSKYFPDMIREYGLESMILKEAEQMHNICHGYKMEQQSVGAYCESLHDAILANPKCLEQFLLVLGGDHSLSIGTVNAIDKLQGSTGVVWVDAHADINTSETSPSENMHGMSVAFLLGLEKTLLKQKAQWGWFKPSGLQPSDVVYVGLRDVDAGETEILSRMGITAYTIDDVDKHGIEGIMDMTHRKLAHKDNLHLSFDIDALDPKVAPHTGTAVSGGLTAEEGVFICESMGGSGRLTSMELVEVNPIINQEEPIEKTLDVAMKLIQSTLHAMR